MGPFFILLIVNKQTINKQNVSVLKVIDGIGLKHSKRTSTCAGLLHEGILSSYRSGDSMENLEDVSDPQVSLNEQKDSIKLSICLFRFQLKFLPFKLDKQMENWFDRSFCLFRGTRGSEISAKFSILHRWKWRKFSNVQRREQTIFCESYVLTALQIFNFKVLLSFFSSLQQRKLLRN